MNEISEDDILSNLNKFFKYNYLHPGQLSVIQKIFEKKDVLVCKESGFGKTLCYQLPGLMREGVVIVLSSLRSRIEEKCTNLAEFKVKCAYLSSSVTSKSYNDEKDLRSLLTKKNKILEDLRNFSTSGLKFLYVTIEYFVNSSRLQAIIKEIHKKKYLQAIVIDDVHCVANFHNTLRKDHAVLGKLRDVCPNAAFLCFIKPISVKNIRMIKNTLKLVRPFILNEPSVIGNVSYTVMYTGNNYYFTQLVDFVKDTYQNKTGIIYCRTKEDCLDVSKKLKEANIRNLYYYENISDDDKNWLQWITSDRAVVTCVTGSDVDIHLQNISFIIHASLPISLDIYMQETSRVNRVENGICVLFYNNADGKANLNQTAEVYREKIKRATSEQRRVLKLEFKDQVKLIFDAVTYAENGSLCRQVFLLSYMNENSFALPCGACDVCEVMKGSFFIDVAYSLRKILMAIWAINTKQRNCGNDTFYDVDIDDLVDLLIGSSKKSLIGSTYPKEWFFASFSSWDRDILQRCVYILLAKRFVMLNFAFNDKFENKARNLIITVKGQAFVKTNDELNIPFSRKDIALTKWLNLDRIQHQFKRDLDNVLFYYSLHKRNNFCNNISFICDLFQNCPSTWEQYKIIRSHYTKNEKTDIDEDLFTVCLMYHRIMRSKYC